LSRYLDTGGHYPDALAIHTHALHAARHTSDWSGEAHALGSLGAVYLRQSRYEQAADHLRQSLTLACEIGDRNEEAVALGNLGLVYQRQGRYEQAADHHQRAIALFRRDRPPGR
jgi:tetratricopeptide (TPR) repeat protein